MRRIISTLLCFTLFFTLFSQSVFAEKGNIEEKSVYVLSNNLLIEYSVYLQNDIMYMSIDDIAQLTGSQLSVNGKTAKITLGTRKITIDANKGKLKEDTINVELKTALNDGVLLVHAYPMLTYLGADCQVLGDALYVNMPLNTIWTGTIRDDNENCLTLDIFGNKTEQSIRLISDFILGLLDDGIVSTILDNPDSQVYYLVLKTNCLDYESVNELVNEHTQKYSSLIQTIESAKEYSLNPELEKQILKLSTKTITDILKEYDEEDLLFNHILDHAKDEISLLKDVYKLAKSIEDLSFISKDSYDILIAYRNNHSFSASESATFAPVLSSLTSENSGKINEVFKKSAIATLKELSENSGKLSDVAKCSTAFDTFSLLSKSISIATSLEKIFNGSQNFDYSEHEYNVIKLLNLKEKIRNDISRLGDKILSEKYSDQDSLEDYRLLNIFYYKTLIAANEEMKKMTEARGTNAMNSLSSFIDELDKSNNDFARKIYILENSKANAYPDIKSITKKNVWDKNSKIKFYKKTVKVVDAVNFEKKVKAIEYQGYEENAYNGYGFHSIKLPKITLKTKNAEKFNEKLYKSFSKEYEDLINNQEEHHLYNCKYEYVVNDNIIGIIIECSRFVQAGGGNCNYYGFYYDLNEDEEISLEQYIVKNGMTKQELTNDIFNSNEYAEYYNYYLQFGDYEEYIKNVKISDCLIDTNGFVVCIDNPFSMDGKDILQIERK